MSEELPEVPLLERPRSPLDANPAQNRYHLAVIIDNIVYQTIQTDGNSAAIFLNNPTFVQITPGQAAQGYTYTPETGDFTAAPLV
jgi:hypothetical protein